MRSDHIRTERSGRGPRRFGAGLALVVAVGVVVVIIAGTGSSSPTAAKNAADASGATTVQRRDLIETDTESGTLSYANAQTVYNRLSGTITWLPSVGQVITPGQPLFKVAGEPVILMDGTTPAYRDLTPSDSAGEDILELNRNLVALGFNPGGIVIDDQWQAATTTGVDVFQASLGQTETGTLALGQVAFLPGDQLVSAVDATLGGTGGASPSGATSADDPAAAATPAFVSLETSTTTSSSSTTSSTTTTTATATTTPRKPRPPRTPGTSAKLKILEALIAQLRAELAELQARNQPPSRPASPSPPSGTPSPSGSGRPSSSGSGNPSSSNSASPSSSNGGGSASAILQTASTKLIATVDLDATKQSEATVGERVTVEMPNGTTVEGRVSAVSPVAQSSSSSGNGPSSGNGSGNNNSANATSTIPVTITLAGHQRGVGLDQAAVSVNFVQARARNVLSVPVTALLATAGGGYSVQEQAVPHKLIPVTPGLFAAGFVQISGPRIYPGLAVTDSQG